jgi:PadR family transcriptional regulator, regulatory protein PadR
MQSRKISKGLMSGSTSLMVLSLLSVRDMYGYEIIQELEVRSENVFSLNEGTLYPVLHTLENGGFAQSYEKTAGTGKIRKYYSITKKGAAQLAEKKAEWKTFSSGVDKVLGELSYAE